MMTPEEMKLRISQDNTRITQLRGKCERQAIKITKLEISRKALRCNNSALSSAIKKHRLAILFLVIINIVTIVLLR